MVAYIVTQALIFWCTLINMFLLFFPLCLAWLFYFGIEHFLKIRIWNQIHL